MRILYVALKHDYGRPEQGHSFEHYNFFDPLARMGHSLLYFDIMEQLRARGREGMNRRLLEVARAARPELIFSVLFRDELDPEVIRRLPDACGAPTLNWFCDDHWRFETFTRHWAPHFTWVITTAAGALPKYARLGHTRVIKSQFACNHFLYRPLDRPPRYDVSFVGLPHGNRRAVIAALRDAGLAVHVWGQGWESGRLSQEEMIEVFNSTRVNLNLSNASTPPAAGGAARRFLSAGLDRLPGGAVLKRLGRLALRAAHPAAEAPSAPGQIKGRNFEIPGCGGFLLTDPAEDLESYYRSGREVACFTGTADLVARVRHYLRHDDERAAIARAGRERTLREHTYVHRFSAIFAAMGLPALPADGLLRGAVTPGDVEEVA